MNMGTDTMSSLCYNVIFFNCQDDGELYDEFGNLKKKFRAKTQQAEAARVLPGSGRAGWEVEGLGILFQEKIEWFILNKVLLHRLLRLTGNKLRYFRAG